jgi:hypothetical protein
LKQQVRAIDCDHIDVRFDPPDLFKASRIYDSVLPGLQIEDWNNKFRQLGANVTPQHGAKSIGQNLWTCEGDS